MEASENMSSLNFSNGFLPNDLIIQILSKLPIKTLFRCKLVCKFWCRLPSEKYFIDLYSQTSSKNPTLLLEIICTLRTRSSYICVDRFSGGLGVSLDFLNDRVKIRASCNGLLCCASTRNRGVYYVCNPMTREFRLLPRARGRAITRCQPEYEATLIGLAFDPKSWKYQVALAGFYRPFGRRPHDQLVCLVLDSDTNVWRRFVTCQYDEFTHMNRNQSVFANGLLHWLTYSCSHVLALDLKDEVWMKISLPEEIVAGGLVCRVYLLELEGEVSVIQMSGCWMNIWVLKDHVREQWILVDRVHLRCIRGLATNAFPMCQTSDVVFLAAQRKVLTYGRKDKVWREVYAEQDSSTYPLWFSAHAFQSTLFPCNQGDFLE
ncbi:F-box protein At5g49610 [Dioscorea cayenensis subsp. rotundata]|uniref:F-box protein At5g49610 n=1 Tax=Dioscorea cayennensis subsp. rotundata TaxID=55577 RepID=A0AB40BH03_DIOCR|nr:F-box protein At5g49610 [Dioscorea cayenensis subsp. rotundata]